MSSFRDNTVVLCDSLHVAAASNGAGSEPDLIAADGSTFTFFSKPKFSPDSYFVAEGHSAKGFYSNTYERIVQSEDEFVCRCLSAAYP